LKFKSECLLAVSLISCGCIAEDFTAVRSPPSPLIAELRSYSNRLEVREALSAPSWSAVNESRLTDGDHRPPYTLQTFSMPFEHLGYTGQLELSFYNDRLMSTLFYPDEFGSYLETLVAAELTGTRDREIAIPPATVVRWVANNSDRPYVLWTDKRLQEQESRWIMRYS